MDPEAWGPAPSLSMGSSQRRLPRRGAARQEFSGCIYLLESKCADTVSAATEFHLAEKQVLIHQARLTLPRLYSGLSTQTETMHCRYTDTPCSFLQASSIIQHVFSTQQQIVSGITRQEHVFGNGVLPAKPGTCSVELQLSALTGSKQQPNSNEGSGDAGNREMRECVIFQGMEIMRVPIFVSFCRANITSPP